MASAAPLIGSRTKADWSPRLLALLHDLIRRPLAAEWESLRVT